MKENIPLENKKQSYFKWLFTRWYLYVTTLLLFISGRTSLGTRPSLAEEIRVAPPAILGELLGSLIVASLVVSVVYLIIKLIKKLIRLLEIK